MHNLGIKLVTSALKDIWIELSQSCDHRCKNCFQATEKGVDKDPDNLKRKQLLDVVNHSIDLGVNEIGIPGAGEPFHPANRRLLLALLDNNFARGVHTTIFTHAGFLNPELIEKLESYKDKITLLIKLNTFDPKQQDWFDDVTGYGKKRNEILGTLIGQRFNDGQRLGIVTSVMNFNFNQLPEIFRWCRTHNIVIDIDPILTRGRGINNPFSVSGEHLLKLYQMLSRIDAVEFDKHWEPTSNYVGALSCDRYRHHLYVTKTGIVHPCVGSTGIILGSVREKSLEEMWDSPEMRIIRERKHTGKCTECGLYVERKCNPCLGRYTENLTNEGLLRNGSVATVGCWAFKKRTKPSKKSLKRILTK
jgi:MoaA/NifB/PqqE/SkfB family radical SAM enzyme